MADPHSGVEQCLLIDAALWMRDGILREGLRHSGTCRWTSPTGELRGGVSFQVNTIDVAYPTVRLLYTMPGTGELDYVIPLQTTQPHWGGVRWWFTCPLVINGRRCGQRVQKLYLPPGCKYYGCRRCYDLGYLSRWEDAQIRARSKAEKVRLRLGGSRSLDETFPDKPKGMWWRTCEHLRETSERAEMRTNVQRSILSSILSVKSSLEIGTKPVGQVLVASTTSNDNFGRGHALICPLKRRQLALQLNILK